jgi:hypothetical protein
VKCREKAPNVLQPVDFQAGAMQFVRQAFFIFLLDRPLTFSRVRAINQATLETPSAKHKSRSRRSALTGQVKLSQKHPFCLTESKRQRDSIKSTWPIKKRVDLKWEMARHYLTLFHFRQYADFSNHFFCEIACGKAAFFIEECGSFTNTGNSIVKLTNPYLNFHNLK